MENFGVLLFALGKRIYGRYAFNLALSLKASMPDVKILLYHDGTAIQDLNAEHRSFFDVMQTMPAEAYVYGDKVSYFRAKSRIYDLSPFEKTLWLDADSLILPNGKLKKKLEDLANSDYQPMCYELLNLKTNTMSDGRPCPPTFHVWGDLGKIKAYYGLHEGLLPRTNSSFVYFRKSERTKRFFDEIKALYADRKAPVDDFRTGELPDEFFFNVACARTEMKPEAPFLPFYDKGSCKWKGSDHLRNEYIGLTLMGAIAPQHVVTIYDATVSGIHKALNVRTQPFKYINKLDGGVKF